MGQTTTNKLSDFVEDRRDELGHNNEVIGAALGVSGESVRKWIGSNKWPKDIPGGLCEVLKVVLDSVTRDTITVRVGNDARKYTVDEWTKPSNNRRFKHQSKTFDDALEAMERCSGTDACEEAANQVVLSAASREGSFLAIVSVAIVPGPLQPMERHPGRLEALYTAQRQGMLVLFVTPNEARVEKLRRVYGHRSPPTSAEYADGFSRYRAGYISHCVAGRVPQRKAESEADNRCWHVEYDDFGVTANRYIMSLIGQADGYGRVKMRIFERGPASGGFLSLIPADQDHEQQMRHYLTTVLEDTYPKESRRPQFATEFLRRLNGRA